MRCVAHIIEITEADDPRVDDFRDLSRADRRPDRPGGRGLVIAEGVVVVERLEQPTFDADPHRFRLGLEARRISTAFTYEMGAVAVSNIQPLPHQLEAVYDEFLPQPRLRFLLADDPGAGKTIMAGLYAKELVLRRAGDRILIVVPANRPRKVYAGMWGPPEIGAVAAAAMSVLMVVVAYFFWVVPSNSDLVKNRAVIQLELYLALRKSTYLQKVSLVEVS